MSEITLFIPFCRNPTYPRRIISNATPSAHVHTGTLGQDFLYLVLALPSLMTSLVHRRPLCCLIQLFMPVTPPLVTVPMQAFKSNQGFNKDPSIYIHLAGCHLQCAVENILSSLFLFGAVVFRALSTFHCVYV